MAMPTPKRLMDNPFDDPFGPAFVLPSTTNPFGDNPLPAKSRKVLKDIMDDAFVAGAAAGAAAAGGAPSFLPRKMNKFGFASSVLSTMVPVTKKGKATAVYLANDPTGCVRRAAVQEEMQVAARPIARAAYKQVAAPVAGITCARSASTAAVLAIRGKPNVHLASSSTCQNAFAIRKQASSAASKARNEATRHAYAYARVPPYLRCNGKGGLGVQMKNAFRQSRYKGTSA